MTTDKIMATFAFALAGGLALAVYKIYETVSAALAPIM